MLLRRLQSQFYAIAKNPIITALNNFEYFLLTPGLLVRASVRNR